MKNYEIMEDVHCHIFEGYGDQSDTLRAIVAWWEEIEASGKSPFIEVIEFGIDDEIFTAAVYWHELPDEIQTEPEPAEDSKIEIVSEDETKILDTNTAAPVS